MIWAIQDESVVSGFGMNVGCEGMILGAIMLWLNGWICCEQTGPSCGLWAQFELC